MGPDRLSGSETGEVESDWQRNFRSWHNAPLGSIILVLDILVVVSVVVGKESPGHNALWSLIVFFIPLLGLILLFRIRVQPYGQTAIGMKNDEVPKHERNPNGETRRDGLTSSIRRFVNGLTSRNQRRPRQTVPFVPSSRRACLFRFLVRKSTFVIPSSLGILCHSSFPFSHAFSLR